MLGPKPDILFAHKDFWVINKPPGWTVQADAHAPGVLGWLKQTHQQAWPVHRLDKPTSGLLLVARNREGNQYLSQAFAERRVSKHYLAVSDHKPKKKQGWVKGDMVPARRSQWKLLHSCSNPAVTHFVSQSVAPGMRGFHLAPKTGKTHQLRVALKSLGAPILGDTLYGGTSAERLYLHAWQLQFDYHGEAMHFSAPANGHWFEHWLQQPGFQQLDNR